jgi:hypothetical protein
MAIALVPFRDVRSSGRRPSLAGDRVTLRESARDFCEPVHTASGFLRERGISVRRVFRPRNGDRGARFRCSRRRKRCGVSPVRREARPAPAGRMGGAVPICLARMNAGSA